MNTFGNKFRLTTFGESHGPAMGGVIDGCPPGMRLDLEGVQRELDRRRPGNKPHTSARRESDRVEWLSGLSPEGVTLGTPIGFMVRNEDMRSRDYDALRDVFRPNHADHTYMARYGIRDHRGGGRASARETLCRVVGGAVARQWLASRGISVAASLAFIGPCPTPDGVLTPEAEALLREVEAAGDSIGGVVRGSIKGMPAGIGNPVADKLHARLGAAMLSINAAMGFEYGAGFGAASMRGSEMADEMQGGRYLSNNCGGINGGISNGEEIYFRVAFKPTPTIARPLRTMTDEGADTVLSARGRHDPCVAIRAVPVVEAMALLTLADQLLLSQ